MSETFEQREKRRQSLHGPFAWVAQNPVFANLLMLTIFIGGLLSANRIKQEVFPEFDMDVVNVSVAYPGASPAEVERGVVLAIEEQVRGVDGVKEVRSTANEGRALVSIELLTGTNRDKALSDIKSAVDRITTFPEDIERPQVSLLTLQKEVLSVMLYGQQSERSLRDLAEKLRDELIQEPEITNVELAAVRPPEISIEVSQRNLRNYGLTLGQIAQAVKAASVEIPGGTIKTPKGDVLVRTTERREHGHQFEDIVVRSQPDGTKIHVGDLGTVIDGFRETDQTTLFNGQPAAMVKVFRVGSQTPVDVSKAVHRVLKRFNRTLPANTHTMIWNDRSELLAQRMDLLMRNARQGLILVLLVLGLLLEIRLAFWVALGIPTSFLGTLLLLPSTGVSINMISLFAFIITLGMVVDDAIVVGEAVYKRRQDGLPALQAAVAGVRDVWGPVVFAVLTTLFTFLPLMFVPGVMGKFFWPIPVIVISVLTVSLGECFLILPAHLAHNKPVKKGGIMDFIHRQQQRVGRRLERFVNGPYRRTLGWFVRWRYVTLAGALATLILSVGLVAGGRVNFTIMPAIESDVVSATLRMPFGTSAEETKTIAERMVKELKASLNEHGGEKKYSRGIFAAVGSLGSVHFSPLAGISTGGHLAEVAVILVSSDERPFTSEQLATTWRKRIGQIPGVESLTFKYQTGPSANEAINIELSHQDLGVLKTAGEALAKELGRYAGVTDIDDGFSPGKPQLDFTLTPEGRSVGITEASLARQLRDAFYGAEAVREQRGRDELRVYVRLPRRERESLFHLENFLLRTPSGGEIPLLVAANIHRGRSYTAIRRKDGRRIINVKANVLRGTNANKVVADVMAHVMPKLAQRFAGLRYETAGRQKDFKESLQALGRGFMLALIAMYTLLAIPFRSYTQPVLIMLVIPFGFIGAFIGHLLLGFNLSLISMMGLVALAGVVVNDSIVMVDAVNLYRQDGMSTFEAVVAGGTRRFRPILLTTLTTFFGLVPLLAETSVQARFLEPMAISLSFGVLFGTVITLLILPALYAMLDDIHGLFGGAANQHGAPNVHLSDSSTGRADPSFATVGSREAKRSADDLGPNRISDVSY